MFMYKNPIDEHLAKRLKLIRKSCGVSQDKLGELVGVTFQQIHKYEAGVNKISASRLYEICRVLNKPLNSFFEDIDIEEGYFNIEFTPENEVARKDRMKNKELMNLTGSFNQITDPEIRLNIINLVSSLVPKIVRK